MPQMSKRLQERNNYDDTKDAIVNRFKIFSELTKPVLEKYKAITINASKGRDEVYGEVEKLLVQELGVMQRIDD